MTARAGLARWQISRGGHIGDEVIAEFLAHPRIDAAMRHCMTRAWPIATAIRWRMRISATPASSSWR
jgi:hypothetical protein